MELLIKQMILVVLLLINISNVKGENDTEAEYNDESKTDQILKESDVIDDTDTQNYARLDNVEKQLELTTAAEKFGINKETGESNKPIDDEVTTVQAIDNVTEDYGTPITEDVYKLRDTTANVEDNNEKTETTSQSTTRAMDSYEATEVSENDETDAPGQRSPKTETSEQHIPDVRYDIKPQTPTPVSKSSTLKGWLEDTWLRPPAGILVPLRPLALNRTLAVWNDLMIEGLNVTDLVIVGYDSNGVNWRSRHNLASSNGGKERDVSEALHKLLLKYQGVNSESSSDGTMRALTMAAKLVPYDSALFVITDKGAGDPQRLPLALRALVEKRLKVYTIWTDPKYPSAESEIALQELRNISKHTEGEVLPYSLMNDSKSSNLAMENSDDWEPLDLPQARRARIQTEQESERFDTVLIWRGGSEAISLGLPVDTGVTALKILIEGAVEHAVLYPPNDAPQIDLFNLTSVAAFSPASRTDNISPREIYLIFPGSSPDTNTLTVVPAHPPRSHNPAAMAGSWHLSVRCDTCYYRLNVAARSEIHLDVDTETSDMVRIRVTGPVASVRESVLVDEFGTELAKLGFSYQPMAGEGQEAHADPITDLLADVPLPSYHGSTVYVKIIGRDIQGESFARLSRELSKPEVRLGRSASLVRFPDTDDLELVEEYSRIRYNNGNATPYERAVSQVVNQYGTLLTAVHIGLSTRLYGAPGDSLQLHFEVTNYREQDIPFRFGAVGNLRFLTGINPAQQTIQSGQTVNVIVSLTIPANAQPGARDLINFTAYGQDEVSTSAYVYVVNPGTQITDVWPPEMSHNFQGTCRGRMGDDCNQHIWSATIIARDTGSGLLRLASSPLGLMYDSFFISGTREEVVATYRATCCTPRVMITALDSYGNVNSYVIDISTYFTEAAIAAIVLGVLLAIVILILIGFSIRWCVRRSKESRELPYTTSSRNIS